MGSEWLHQIWSEYKAGYVLALDTASVEAYSLSLPAWLGGEVLQCAWLLGNPSTSRTGSLFQVAMKLFGWILYES